MFKKAFIFSLDSFMALTLVIIMLHSLIFISSIPSTYYTNFIQVKFLAQDILFSLSKIDAYTYTQSKSYMNKSLLDYIILVNDPEVYQTYIGNLVPNQFGYRVIMYNPKTKKYDVLYDTADYPEDPHSKEYHKLMATSYIFYYSYKEQRSGWRSYYKYITCSCGSAICPTECDYPVSLYNPGEVGVNLIGLTIYR